MGKKIRHLTWKKSWWDGSVISWCGQRAASGEYVSDLFYIGPAKTCPACERAWKNAQ